MRLRHFPIIKEKFLRALRRAFVSGLAGNGEMSLASRLTGNFTEHICVCVWVCLNVWLQVSAFWGKCFVARYDSHFPQYIKLSGCTCLPSATASQTLRAVLKPRCGCESSIQAEAERAGLGWCLFGALCQRGSYSPVEGMVVKIQCTCTDGHDESRHKASSFSAG